MSISAAHPADEVFVIGEEPPPARKRIGRVARFLIRLFALLGGSGLIVLFVWGGVVPAPGLKSGSSPTTSSTPGGRARPRGSSTG